jgi:hypothetical protein
MWDTVAHEQSIDRATGRGRGRGPTARRALERAAAAAAIGRRTVQILFGLAGATVLVIGWIYGNVFACVFLTLGTIGILGFGALLAFAHGNATDHTFGGWTVVIGLSVLAIILAPYSGLFNALN